MVTNRQVVSGLHPSNDQLVALCRTGDQDAWVALIKRYERLVYSIPIKEGLSEEAAADITQYTFTELLKYLNQLNKPSELASWLMQVCRREVWRVKGTEAPTLLLSSEHGVLVEDFSDAVDREALVYDAVQALGEPCRTLIIGMFLDPSEPDYQTLALRVGRPIGSVGPLRGRCLERLRALIEEADRVA